MLYDHFQKLSMGYYHNKQTGQLMSRVVNDTSTFESLIAHAIPDLATNIMTLLGVLLILMSISPKLTLLVCIPLPFIAILSFVLRKIRRYFKKGQKKIAELNAILQDNFSGMKEIQVFNKQDYELERSRKNPRNTRQHLLGHCFIRRTKSFGEFYFFHRYRNCFDSRTDIRIKLGT
jgi:ABC-type multidrug transport system fused ATPase/permease subunit